MKVIVYTTTNCSRCRTLKRVLDAAGLEYEERSLEDSDVATELAMRNAPIMSAPSIEVAGMVFEYRGGDA